MNPESTLEGMLPEADPAELIGREPDERLLHQDLLALPDSVGRPAALVAPPARRLITGAGAALTAVSLLAGIVLIGLGGISGLGAGLSSEAIVELVAGLALVATHWGWVHVSEFVAGALEERCTRETRAERRDWLLGIEPYARFSVQSESAADGSITIITQRHRPVPTGEHSFTFSREVITSEHHHGAEAGAEVAERAELLRREAAAATARERTRFESARNAAALSSLAREDEEQRRAALRAESEALSEQINANLRNEPLDS